MLYTVHGVLRIKFSDRKFELVLVERVYTVCKRRAQGCVISSFLLLKTAPSSLKGQSHEKVYEFLTWDGSFSQN
jgi:hypothetical protein